MPTVDVLNGLTPDAVKRELRACCASARWIEAVAAARPYSGEAALLAASDDAMASLLGPAAEGLAGAGIEVLWPSSLVDGGTQDCLDGESLAIFDSDGELSGVSDQLLATRPLTYSQFQHGK